MLLCSCEQRLTSNDKHRLFQMITEGTGVSFNIVSDVGGYGHIPVRLDFLT